MCTVLCVYARLLSVAVDYIDQSCFHRANAPCHHWMDSLNVRSAKKTFVFAKTTILFFISRVHYAFKMVPVSKRLSTDGHSNKCHAYGCGPGYFICDPVYGRYRCGLIVCMYYSVYYKKGQKVTLDYPMVTGCSSMVMTW